MRARPSRSFTRWNSSARSVGGARSRPQALTVCPSSVTSRQTSATGTSITPTMTSAVELRHAAHDADHEVRTRGLEPLELAELGEDLVLGLLANRAGVEQDDVGFALVGGELVVTLAEQAGNPLGVVLVHLAAVRDQVELVGHARPANP